MNYTSEEIMEHEEDRMEKMRNIQQEEAELLLWESEMLGCFKQFLAFWEDKIPGVTEGVGGPELIFDYEGMYNNHAVAIVWEGGPFEWTEITTLFDNHLLLSDGFWTESINHYAIAIHHDRDV